MRLQNTLFTLAACAVAAASPANAALVWTGANDQISLYREANWLDDNNAVPANNTINANTDVSAATGGLIEISSGSGSPSNYTGDFITGNGNSLTVANGKTLASGGRAGLTGSSGTALTVSSGATLRVGATSGFSDYSFSDATVDLTSLSLAGGTLNSTTTDFTVGSLTVDDGTNGTVESLTVAGGTFSANTNITLVFTDLVLDAASASFSGGINGGGIGTVVHLTNGSSWASTFITNMVEFHIDATSSMSLSGTGDPINSQTNPSTIHLEIGAQLTLSSFAEFSEHTGEIFVNGVSYAADPSILQFSGSTATAVPESSAPLLTAIACFGWFARRRRKN